MYVVSTFRETHIFLFHASLFIFLTRRSHVLKNSASRGEGKEKKRDESEADSERLLIAIQLRILTRIMNTAPQEPPAEPAEAPDNHLFTCVITAQTSLVTK